MTRRTYIYDRDLEAIVEIGAGTNRELPTPSGMQIIRDIEPYRTAGADIAHGNKRIIVGSRSEHRDFLRRNKYVEVGNDVGGLAKPPPSPSEMRREQADRVADIKRGARAAGLDWF